MMLGPAAVTTSIVRAAPRDPLWTLRKGGAQLSELHLSLIEHLSRAGLAVASLRPGRARLLDNQARVAFGDGVILVVLAVAQAPGGANLKAQE
jgi:hypothetical protein